MQKIEEGLFAVESKMPCSPNDIQFYPYLLASTLERAEREEAAARIITFSQQLGSWVGVSWPRLMKMTEADYELDLLWDEVRKHNFEEQDRVNRATRRYYVLSVLTFGIYSLFVKKPTTQLREEPSKTMPFTIVTMYGPEAIATGIRELGDREMLRIEQVGDGDDAIDVAFPTPALILRIMQKQGIAPATA